VEGPFPEHYFAIQVLYARTMAALTDQSLTDALLTRC
jgi:hypothetical protein